MKKRGILDDRLPLDIVSNGNVDGTLEAVLDTLESMQDVAEEQRTFTCYHDGDGGLFERSVFGTDFADWLYNPDAYEGVSRDLIREFQRRIERSCPIPEEEYRTLLDRIERNRCKDELAVSIHTDEACILYVATPERFLAAKQWYLSHYVPKSKFTAEAPECFPCLFFHQNVSSTINNLNVDYKKEIPLIVEHLRVLNQFAELRIAGLRKQGCSNRAICDAFEEFSRGQIECSPQTNQSSKKSLNFCFLDDENNTQKLNCEYHTKLKWNRKNMEIEKQDRIYFHPGRADIAGGKILIAHIGPHQ